MDTINHSPAETCLATKESPTRQSSLLQTADSKQVQPLVNRIFRILRHLNKDIRRNHPLVRQPSSYLLKKFVDTYLNSDIGQQQTTQNRQELKFIIEECLQFLQVKCLSSKGCASLVNGDTAKPLFPNPESFAKEEAIKYFQSAMHTYKLATSGHFL